ncbi:LysR substrate-binding domain-containing protein [Streptomyces boninensis]|uniref:DUF488 family protein, N3 subclade n=1 Tax=Streptomyces boninensis TaxID=2039455 RepID=UPI003B216C04
MFGLDRLRALDAVRTHGSIARAADALHITASGVSQQLAKLERESGHRLLEPYGRSVRLTHAGRVLAEHAARVCAQAAAAEAELAALGDEILGPLRLGGVGSSLRALLPDVLVRLTAEHPRLTPTVIDGEAVDLVPQLIAGNIDLLLSESWDPRPLVLPPGLGVRTLAVEDVQVALAAGHPLAARAALDLTELGGLVWASCPVGTEPYEALTQALRGVGLEPEVRYPVTEYATQLAFVRGGLCAALVPEMAQQPCPPGVRFVPLRPPLTRTVQAAWRTRAASPAVLECLAALQAVVAPGGAECSGGAVAKRAPDLRVRRIYDAPDPGDGTRILVDRLWPRGVAKADAHVDEWPKAVTPSTELRKWYHAGEGTYEEFARRYRAELAEGEAADALAALRELVAKGPATLLTASKDVGHSHAAVLLAELQELT